MSRSRCTQVMFLFAAVCMIWGITRATSLKFEQQRDAFLKIAVVEQKKLGLTDRAKLFAKYPTPELTMCKAAKVTPGATTQVVLAGKFQPGTKFFYENDAIEVVNDAVTAVQYRATIRAANDALPCLTLVHALTPVSGGTAMCHAVHVNALPDWRFSAANGWTILLVEGEEKPVEEGAAPTHIYTVQFFKPGQREPFESFKTRLSLIDACPRGSYTADLFVEGTTAGPSQSVIEEYGKLAQRLNDPKITPQEYEKILNRMTELAAKMQAGNEAMMAGVQKSNEAGIRLEKFGCKQLSFKVAAGAATGNLTCYDSNTGQPREIKVTGAAKARA